jgi:hypothetical protein
MNTIIATTTNDALVAKHITTISAKKGSSLMGTALSLLIEEAKRQIDLNMNAQNVFENLCLVIIK